MSLLKSFLKEPLVHFLFIGFALFIIFNEAGDNNNNDIIVVDHDRLLTFIQYRAKEFDQQKYSQILDSLPAEQKQNLINDYVREEALYREAKALRLDQNDNVARRRMIQQLEYMTRGFITTNINLSDADLQQFLNENQVNYTVADKITFTHVFLKSEDKTKSLLDDLNNNQVAFHQAMQYGDRFLYKRNYVNKDAEEIASHFGSAMRISLFDLKPSDKIWQGPFRSDYGYHLVMLTDHKAGYVPTLNDIRERVRQDAFQLLIQKKLDEAMQLIVEQYDVDLMMGKAR